MEFGFLFKPRDYDALVELFAAEVMPKFPASPRAPKRA
jgi:hypothetical protein